MGVLASTPRAGIPGPLPSLWRPSRLNRLGPGEGLAVEFGAGVPRARFLGGLSRPLEEESQPRAAEVDATPRPLGPPELLRPPAALGLGRREDGCLLHPGRTPGARAAPGSGVRYSSGYHFSPVPSSSAGARAGGIYGGRGRVWLPLTPPASFHENVNKTKKGAVYNLCLCKGEETQRS